MFGIGASADRHTLASRLTENDSRETAWVNFGGRSFNSTQEMILFCLHRHLLPPIKEIVLFSGFNDLGLSRLPAASSKTAWRLLQLWRFLRCPESVPTVRIVIMVQRREGW